MSSETGYGNAADVRFRAVGVGLDIRWHCLGCDQRRPSLGAKGTGLRKRCAVCLAARAERKGAAG